MGLRLNQGISLEQIFQVYGDQGLGNLWTAIAPHIAQKWVMVERAAVPNSHNTETQNIKKLEATDRIRLSDPEGFLMSNVVIVDAFNALETLGKSEEAMQYEA